MRRKTRLIGIPPYTRGNEWPRPQWWQSIRDWDLSKFQQKQRRCTSNNSQSRCSVGGKGADGLMGPRSDPAFKNTLKLTI